MSARQPGRRAWLAARISVIGFWLDGYSWTDAWVVWSMSQAGAALAGVRRRG